PPHERPIRPPAAVDPPGDADRRQRQIETPGQPAAPPDDLLDLLAAARSANDLDAKGSGRTPPEEAEYAELVEEDVLEDAGKPRTDSVVDLDISPPRLAIDQSPIPLPSGGDESEELLLGESGQESTTLPHDAEEPVEISSSELVGEEVDPLVAGAESSGNANRDPDHDPSIILTQDDLVGTG